MAGVSNAAAEVLLSKRVQEMALNGEDPPALYICRDGGDHKEDDFLTLSPIPVIDLSLLLPSSSATCTRESKDELHKLKAALSSWGCFQAIGHGISSAFLEEILQVTKEFFKQPMEEKRKLAKQLSDWEGYGADPVPELGQPLDWSDRLYLEVYPEDKRNYCFWPEKPKSFRGIVEEYTEKMKMVTQVTSKVMAKSLHLEENCFLDQFGDHATIAARFNYYSCCQRPDLVLGLKPHSDASGFTILLQDEVGLQILKDDKWFTVPKHSDALLILLGDQMEIMTNGIFKSPVHRVLSNFQSQRISVAMFYNPAIDKEIGPHGRLVNQESPRLFKDVKDYGTTYFEYYSRGMRALHTAQI